MNALLDVEAKTDLKLEPDQGGHVCKKGFRLSRILAELKFAPRANPLDENRVGKTVQANGIENVEELLVAKGRKGNVHARRKNEDICRKIKLS